MQAQPIYVVDGARTPFLKSKNRPGPFAASDLATQAGRTLLVRQPFAPSELDEVILGCAAPSVAAVNMGRVAGLGVGSGRPGPRRPDMRHGAAGHLAPGGGEVEALYDTNGKAYALDDGVRSDASPESLGKLRPFFDRKYGNVTAGNSSQITDGAAWLILASEEAMSQHGLQPIGRIVDSEWAGLDPAQ